MRIKDLMREAFITEKDMSLADAAKLMSSKEIGSLLYVEKGKIKGILTERDVLKNFGKSKKISDIMSQNVITVEQDEDVNGALGIMTNHKIKRLPVLKKGELVGIITLTDIAANVDELEDGFFFD